jgi:hypothetical protein
VRASEFWRDMEGACGTARARTLADDLVLTSLGGRTPSQALTAGVPPRQVWTAVCEAMDLDEASRWAHRDGPTERRGR